MDECGGSSGICQVSRDVDGLDLRDGALLGGGDPFLHGAHVGGEGGLAPHGGHLGPAMSPVRHTRAREARSSDRKQGRPWRFCP